MSANNFLFIYKKNRKYILECCDVDTGKPYAKITETKSLKYAIKRANEYQMENEVEYGLDIKI